MRKTLHRDFSVKIFACGAAVLCVFSLSATIASELRPGETKTTRQITSWSKDAKLSSRQISLSGAGLPYVREYALRAVEHAATEIAALGLSTSELAGYEKLLPPEIMPRLHAVIEISKLDVNPEERTKALLEIQGYNCQDYLITWFTIEVVEIFVKTSCHLQPDPTCELALEVLRLADTVFFWATVLCYLGIV